MANHASALKRVRQTRARTARNRATKSQLRTAIKKLRVAIDSKDQAQATELFNETISRIDKSIQKGALHHNAADRYKSHLTQAYNELVASKA